MPISKVVVLGVQKRAYLNRQNQEVNNCFVYYYNSADLHNSRLERGYLPMVMDVYPDLAIDSFEPEFPALYTFKSCIRRDLRTGKGVPSLQSVEFIDNVTIDDADSFLVLGAKRIDFEVDGERYRGVKLFYVDLNSYLATGDVVGLLPIEQNIAGANFDVFQNLPAYYDLDLQEARGRGGSAVYKLRGAKFKAVWNRSESSSSSYSPLVS